MAEDPTAAYSGDRVIGNDLTQNGTYSADKTSSAESPIIDLGGHQNVRIQFWRWLAVEDSYSDEARIVVNGKKVWENDGANGQLHHIDKEWRFEDINISWIPLSGGTTAVVRFDLSADDEYEAGGWTIDDFCIVAWSPPVVETGAGGGGGAGGAPDAGGGVVTDEGCACHAGGGGEGAGKAASVAALALVALARRRRRMAVGKKTCSHASF